MGLNPTDIDITSDVETITPETALDWLTANVKNRTVKNSKVARYASDMAKGLWQLNGEPIKFDQDGRLLDGQHRLMAVVESEVTVQSLVVRGLPTESQLTMDQGTARGAGDQAYLAGAIQKNTERVSSAIRCLITWTRGDLFSRAEVSNAEIVQWAEQNQDDVRFLEELSHRFKKRSLPRPSAISAVALVVRWDYPEEADQFLLGLIEGIGLVESDPRLALRNRWERDRTQGVNPDLKDVIGFTIMAFNHYRRGNSLTKMQRPVGNRWTAANFPRLEN